MSGVRAGYVRVRRRAEETIKGLSEPPVMLEKLLEDLSIELHYRELEPEVCGFLLVDRDNKAIVVNKSHPNTRQRFTIAHEIGHFTLHKFDEIHVDSDEIFTPYWRDSASQTATQRREIEANAFAANLLMPAKWILADIASEEYRRRRDGALAWLADRYGVSDQSMAFRISSLSKRPD